MAGITSPWLSVDAMTSGLGNLTTNRQWIDNGAVRNITDFSPELTAASTAAQQGLTGNLNYLKMDPIQRLNSINDSPFFQELNAWNNRDYQNNYKTLLDDLSGRGLDTSTIMGGGMAQLALDKNLNDLAAKTSALGYQDNFANSAIASQNATLGNLAGIGGQLGDLATGQMQGLLGNQLQAQQFNAQQEMMKKQQRQKMLGGLIGAGLSLASIPLTGGLSGIGAAGAAAKGIGGVMGNFVTR